VAGGLGSLLAAFLTPPITARIGGWRWITILLGMVGILVFALGLPFQPMLLVIATFFVNVAAQGTKIVVDTNIQQECADDYRGRVFSVNDTSYNLCFVLGLFLAVSVVPETGRSVLTILAVSIGFLALTGWYGLAASRIANRPRQPVAV
jgi:MFS family permease